MKQKRQSVTAQLRARLLILQERNRTLVGIVKELSEHAERHRELWTGQRTLTDYIAELCSQISRADALVVDYELVRATKTRKTTTK
jgi:hypothetical protein